MATLQEAREVWKLISDEDFDAMLWTCTPYPCNDESDVADFLIKIHPKFDGVMSKPQLKFIQMNLTGSGKSINSSRQHVRRPWGMNLTKADRKDPGWIGTPYSLVTS